MKKIVFGAALALSSLEMTSAMNGAIVPVGENRIGANEFAGISRGNTGVLVVRDSEQSPAKTVREAIRYNSFVFSGNGVLITFDKGIERENGSFQNQEGKKEQYPCVKNLLEIIPGDTDDISFAVFKVLAETQELGTITLLERYVDEEHPLQHQEEVISTIEDDSSLETKKTVQTFVRIGDDEHVVCTKEVSTPYSFTDRTEDRDEDDTHYRKWTVRDFVRGNGETFSRDWQDLGLIEKRPPAPPVEAAVPQQGQTVHHNNGRGNRNDVEQFFHKIFRW